MIPLIVLGSLPRMGCICADGQHKTFCQRHLQGNREGGCVCCEGRKDAATTRGSEKADLSTKGRTCCQGGGKRSSESPGFSQGRPCRPVVDRTEIVTPAKASLDLDRVDVLPHFLAVQQPSAVTPVIAQRVTLENRVLRPDLITTLGVLLI